MTIQDVLREMREMREINSNFRVTAEWVSAIEAAMRDKEEELDFLRSVKESRGKELEAKDAEIEQLNRLITLANAYISDLEEHEGAEGFSTSTWELSDEYYTALAGKQP